MTRIAVIRACFACVAIPMSALADPMIGSYSLDGTTPQPMFAFAPDAQGAAAPLRQPGGPSSGLREPGFGAYEPTEGVIYVSDFRGQAIRVFPAFANGDVAPLRVIDPPVLGQTRANVPLAAFDELLVIAVNCCIYTFPLHANGSNVARTRSIVWGGSQGGLTQLNNPFALTYLPASDEVAVIDSETTSPFATRVIFHARTADGNVAPTRILQSDATASASGLAHDAIGHRLFLLTRTTADQENYTARIRVFDDAASGDDAPLYTIEGPSTQLDHVAPDHPSGLGIDGHLHRLMAAIATSGDPARNRLVVFDLDAAGDAVPLQQLGGGSLGAGSLGTPFAVPSDAVFGDGFEP